jgi:hypothetical protein
MQMQKPIIFLTCLLQSSWLGHNQKLPLGHLDLIVIFSFIRALSAVSNFFFLSKNMPFNRSIWDGNKRIRTVQSKLNVARTKKQCQDYSCHKTRTKKINWQTKWKLKMRAYIACSWKGIMIDSSVKMHSSAIREIFSRLKLTPKELLGFIMQQHQRFTNLTVLLNKYYWTMHRIINNH